ncbi:MAG: hypothetical protein LWX56_08190 [Ignavibacteria bacterium]|nr:hypothetical protein [Ignavibacteria bacterium]
MRQIYTLFLCIIIVPLWVSAQSVVDDFYLKIEKKLALDKKYLNLYALNFQATPDEAAALGSFKRANGESVSFQSKENLSYSIVLLKENFEIDTLTLIAVKKIEDKAASSDKFFSDATSGPKTDTSLVLTFRDLQEMYFSQNAAYRRLLDFVQKRMAQEDAVSLLGLNVSDKATKSRSVTSADNTDYLLYSKANSIHRLPKFSEDVKKPAVARRRGAQAEQAATDNDYSLDVSLSRWSFAHKSMDMPFASLSSELSTETRALNLTPWTSMSLNAGVRALFAIPKSGVTANLKQDFLIDAIIGGRMRLNTSTWMGKIPFVFGGKPSLNIGPGLIMDITGSRAYDLPFFNIYYAVGSVDVSTPYVHTGEGDTTSAYFSFKQWEASFAFFWNSSEERTLRYRMDIGVGNYDIYLADYVKGKAQGNRMIHNKINPLVALSATFAPQNIDFLSMGAKYYDGRITLNFWLRVFELSPNNVFRLEAKYITTPVMRSLYPWESTESNSIVQIRYRYAM